MKSNRKFNPDSKHNQIQLEDSTDGDFNDLTVTPNKGKFTSDSRYEFT